MIIKKLLGLLNQNSKMRILYYHQYFKTRKVSGGGRSYEFAKRLVKNGHDVTIVCNKYHKEDLKLKDNSKKGFSRGNIDGINIIQIDLLFSNKQNFLNRAIGFAKFVLKSIRFIFKEEYDLLFASSTPLTIGIPGIVLKLFNKNKKFVFEVRDLWPELPIAMGIIRNPVIKWILKRLEILIYNKADGIIALSPGIAEGIRKTNKNKKPVTLIPNASDTDLFYPANGDKTIIPSCNSNNFIAVFTGTHGKANGLDYVIDIGIELKNSCVENIKLVLIGDGSEKNRLMEKAIKQELDNCIFLDLIPKNELPRYMQACDIGMMILADVPEFSYGTSPNKFFDYLACGMPVIVNHYGWISDLLSEYQCGLTADPKNPHDFSLQLIKLSYNPELCAEMSINARKLAENSFSRDNLANQFENFLKQISSISN